MPCRLMHLLGVVLNSSIPGPGPGPGAPEACTGYQYRLPPAGSLTGSLVHIQSQLSMYPAIGHAATLH